MIETERLILREIDPERDFEAWARSMADENTVRYLGTRPMSRAEAWRSMAHVIGHWKIRGYGFFSLESKATGEWVGRVGPWNPEGWPAPIPFPMPPPMPPDPPPLGSPLPLSPS